MSDTRECDIVKFLEDLGTHHLSDESTAEVRSQIRIYGELESLGDSGEAISRSIMKMNTYGRHFSSDHLLKIAKMTGILSQAYDDMIYNLQHSGELDSIRNAEDDEVRIKRFRDECRDKELSGESVSDETYFETVFFLNVLEDLERMGDFLINISQNIVEK